MGNGVITGIKELEERIHAESAKLEKLLKKAGYKMINFDIEKNHSKHTGLSIIIRAIFEEHYHVSCPDSPKADYSKLL